MRTTQFISAGLTVTLVVISILAFCLPAQAQIEAFSSSPAFPIPRAEHEFTALIPGIQDYCEHVTKQNPKAFIVAATVYGPLDLEVRKARSPQEASNLRLFHFGLAAAASQLPKEVALRFGQPFQHAPGDIQARKQRLVAELPQIEAFVQRFNATPQVTLLTHWGFTGEYRVNDMFHIMDQTKEAIPSPVMGFVPSDQWRSFHRVQEYFDTIHLSQAAFDDLNNAFTPLFIVAARRVQNGDVTIVGTGIANDASGLLFVHDGGDGPVVSQTLPNGSKYSVVEEVKPGIYYLRRIKASE